MRQYLSLCDRIYRIFLFAALPVLYLGCLFLAMPAGRLVYGTWTEKEVLSLTRFFLAPTYVELLFSCHFLPGIYKKKGTRTLMFMTAKKGEHVILTALRMETARIFIYKFLAFLALFLEILFPIQKGAMNETKQVLILIFTLADGMLFLDGITLLVYLLVGFTDSTQYIPAIASLLFIAAPAVLDHFMGSLSGKRQIWLFLVLLFTNICLVYLREYFAKSGLKRRFYDE